MSPSSRHRPSVPSSPDDQSTVREKSTPSASPPASAGASRERLEAKLQQARDVLARLPSVDHRARLLHVAIMRRDEALLDGVLSSLGVTPSEPPGR